MTVLVSDSFNRADDTTTLGTTDSYTGGTAKTWSTAWLFGSSSAWGISGNKAASQTTNSNAKAYVDAGVSDSVKITVDLGSTGTRGILFRYSSETSYFWLAKSTGFSGNGFILRKSLGGGDFQNIGQVGTVAMSSAVTAAIELSGSTIKVYENGVLVGTFTDSSNLTNTKYGIQGDNVGTFDNFIIEDFTASGTTVTGSASGGSTTNGTSAGVSTLAASAAGGSVTNGTSAGVSTLAASAAGGSVTNGTSTSVSTLAASSAGGSQSGGTSANVATLNASASGGSTTGGTSTSTAGTLIQASAYGGSTTGGTSVGTVGILIQASTYGGSVSNGNVTRVAYQQTASVNGGSTSNGQSVGVAYMSIGVNGGSITGGQAFAALLQKAFSLGGSTSNGSATGISGTTQTAPSSGGSTSNGSATGISGTTQTAPASGGSISNGLATGVQALGNPIIIGHVHLKGSRSLYVYLSGSRSLHTHLSGSRTLSVRLKGDVSMPKTGQDFTVVAGTDYSPIFTITDEDNKNAAVNLLGSSVRWSMRRDRDGAPSILTKTSDVNGGIAITNGLGGELMITFVPADTANIHPGRYVHEAKITDGNEKTSRIFTGIITIEGSSI